MMEQAKPGLALAPHPEKLRDIECLRALAIVYTLVAHFRFSFHDVPGWIGTLDSTLQFWGGVDLFFVISGFVISKNLIPAFRDVVSPHDSVKLVLSFWVRRIYRLLPSAWLWAFLSVAVVAVTNRDALTKNVYDLFAALLQVYNFHAYLCVLGAATCSHLTLGAYWSLSLEEQFYIFLPVVFLMLRRRAWMALLGLLAFSIPVQLWGSGLLGFFRWDGFCAGVFLAWLYSHRELHALVGERLLSRLGGIVTLGGWLMVLALPVVAAAGTTSLRYPLIALCSAVLVMLASYENNALKLPMPLRNLGVFLGARSYSIYLIHLPVFCVFQWLSRRVDFLGTRWAQLGWILAASAVVLLLSDLNFRWVETTFRRRGVQRAAQG